MKMREPILVIKLISLDFILITLVSLLIISSTADDSADSSSRQTQSHTKPNIVFILADDLGWNDVGFHGSRQVQTPHLDRLAGEGLILNNYYTQPMCTPSRAALMTGRYPIRTGMQHKVVINRQRMGLPLHLKLLPQHLNDLGYLSHAVGKWHLGHFHESFLPTSRGFESFYGLYNGKGDYFSHLDTELGMTGLDWHLDEGPNRTDLHSELGEYATRAFATRADKLISEHDFERQPMFLYMALTAPHSALPHDPLQVPFQTEQQVTGTYHTQRRKYLGMLKEMDDSIGRIVASLKTKGVLDNTIIIFSSDNGGAPNGFQFGWGSNYPLRSSKGFFYEGGCRVAGFVWGTLFARRAGQVATEMMHISDWLPTLYDFAGGNVEHLENIDGFSMVDVLTGRNLTSPRTEFVLNFDPLENAKSMRVGKYKYLLNPEDFFVHNDLHGWYQAPGEYPGTNETMIPNTHPAQITCENMPQDIDLRCFSQISQRYECLFDIDKDPCEFHNLIDDEDYAEVKEKLLERIEYWEGKQVPPMRPPVEWDANPKFFDHTWNPWTNDPTIHPTEPYTCHPKHCPPDTKINTKKLEL